MNHKRNSQVSRFVYKPCRVPRATKQIPLQKQQHHHAGPIKKLFSSLFVNKPPQRYRRLIPHLPPQVRAQQPRHVSSFFSIFKYFTWHQLTALLFFLLICTAYAADVTTNIEHATRSKLNLKPEPVDKKALTQQIYQKICTDTSLHTYNKPNVSIAVDEQGSRIPKTCNTEIIKYNECKRDIVIWTQFKPDYNRLDRIQKNILSRYQSWKQSTIQQWQQYASQEDSLAVENSWKAIGNLVMWHHASIIANQEKGGDCVLHANVALYNLLKHKMAYGLNMKLQRILLKKNLDNNSEDHLFLLLDSDIADQQIQNDRVAVETFFKSIKYGKICDTWNQGYFQDFILDDSGFYTSKAGWDTLIIENFSLDFAPLMRLSDQMKNFICEQIISMGFEIKNEPLCSQFFADQSDAQSSVETDFSKSIGRAII